MRRWMMGLGSLTALAAAPALALQAGGGDRPPAQPITRAQVQAMVRDHFAVVDTNHDGAISRDEAEAARGAMGAPAGADRASPPAGGAGGPGGGPRMGGGGMGMFTMLNARTFDRVDADHDGKVTQAEAETAAMRLFDMVDADHDGTISPDERRVAREMMRLSRGGGGGN